MPVPLFPPPSPSPPSYPHDTPVHTSTPLCLPALACLDLAFFWQVEKERRGRRAAEVAKLRGDREVQLEEQSNRRQVAAELRRRGEAELSARIALDVKRQLEVGGWQGVDVLERVGSVPCL